MKHLLLGLLLVSATFSPQKASAGETVAMVVSFGFFGSQILGTTFGVSSEGDVDVNQDLRQDAREFIISNGVQYSELLNRMVEVMKDHEPGITEEEVANRILLKKIIIK